MGKILNAKFFERPAPDVAQGLLGKYLVRRSGGVARAYKIIETEAYEGLSDLASHASKGKTKRTEVMFGDAGVFYIYLVYGMYYMLNVVTSKKGHPSAVLIRGVKEFDGREICGPGCLTRDLHIGKELNSKPASLKSGLWFEDGGDAAKFKVKKSPRIGVSYAGPIWSKKLWRFELL